MVPPAIFQGKYPGHQRLDIAVGDPRVGWHRHRAPDANAPALTFASILGQRSRVPFVLCGDVLKRGTDDLSCPRHGTAPQPSFCIMAWAAARSSGPPRFCGCARSRCRSGRRRTGGACAACRGRSGRWAGRSGSSRRCRRYRGLWCRGRRVAAGGGGSLKLAPERLVM